MALTELCVGARELVAVRGMSPGTEHQLLRAGLFSTSRSLLHAQSASPVCCEYFLVSWGLPAQSASPIRCEYFLVSWGLPAQSASPVRCE
eukprot:1195956-Prorocentrum_minimum.AAC.2